MTPLYRIDESHTGSAAYPRAGVYCEHPGKGDRTGSVSLPVSRLANMFAFGERERDISSETLMSGKEMAYACIDDRPCTKSEEKY